MNPRFLCCVTVIIAQCACFFPKVVQPMPYHEAPGVERDHVLIMLPGRASRLASFLRHDFHQEDHRQTLVFADAHFGYYRDRSVVDRIMADLVASRDVKKLTMGGISLGGFGALAVAIEHPERVDDVVLFAPFLGDRAFLERLERGAWDKAPEDDELTRKLLDVWGQLRRSQEERGFGVRVYCGLDDKLKPQIQFLDDLQSDIAVSWFPGGHDWSAWREMWRAYLASES